jgi:hypothetical protein
MSCFISLAAPDGAFLLTDGAVWSAVDQTLVDIRRKVYLARSARLAVTTRGPFEVGKTIAEEICARADEIGAAAMIENLQAFADDIREERGPLDGLYSLQVLVTAYIPGIGGVHRSFDSINSRHRDDAGTKFETEPFEVFQPPQTFVSGTGISVPDLMANDLLPRYGESTSKWFRRTGVGMMEIIRRRPIGVNFAWIVGGQCDLTSLTKAGGRVETLQVWPDRIGERIDPSKDARPDALASPNRRERRRAGALRGSP